MICTQTRRQFLATSASLSSAIGAGKLVTHADTPTTEKVRMVAVGIGGRGSQNIAAMQQSGLAKFVGLCDIDFKHESAKKTLDLLPGLPHFTDFRKAFDDFEDQFDAAVISTPDHTHFVIAMEAMRRGKHVYVEKPLAHSFHEVDLLLKAEAKFGVVTQLGNQGHSEENYYQAAAWSEAGVFDDVTQVIAQACHKKFWHDWNISGYRSEPKPDHIDWDAWLGPRQPVPFSETLHPGRWRAWHNFGSGILGDWGCHTIDTAHRFMKLGFPKTIENLRREHPNDWIYPSISTLRMTFPSRGSLPPVELRWHDGHNNFAENGFRDVDGKFRLFGKVLLSPDRRYEGASHGAPLRATTKDGDPIDDMPSYEMPAYDVPGFEKNDGNHQFNFLRACLGLEKTNSPFSIGGPLTQVLHVGEVAQRLGGKFSFDRSTRRFVGDRNQQANAILDGPEVPETWQQYYRV